MSRPRWQRVARGFDLELDDGWGLVIRRPRPLSLCQQWFAGIAMPGGQCIADTHSSLTRRGRRLSDQAAKTWAREWAVGVLRLECERCRTQIRRLTFDGWVVQQRWNGPSDIDPDICEDCGEAVIVACGSP